MPNDMTPPSAEFASNAHIDAARYREMYDASVSDPEAFWGEHGKRIDWIKPYSTVKDVSFAPGNISIKWFEDGTLNVCANCVDRHLQTRGDQTAIIWEPDSPDEKARHITYAELHREVCRMANILEDMGVRKGDRVILYLPMIPRGGLRDAGLRPDRCHPFDRLRGVLGRCAGRTGQWLRRKRWSSPPTTPRAAGGRRR